MKQLLLAIAAAITLASSAFSLPVNDFGVPRHLITLSWDATLDPSSNMTISPDHLLMVTARFRLTRKGLNNPSNTLADTIFAPSLGSDIFKQVEFGANATSPGKSSGSIVDTFETTVSGLVFSGSARSSFDLDMRLYINEVGPSSLALLFDDQEEILYDLTNVSVGVFPAPDSIASFSALGVVLLGIAVFKRRIR